MENAGMFEALVENSDNIIIVTDSSFNIRYVSSAIEKSFEMPPAKLLGRNVFDFVNNDRVQQWKDCLQEQNNSLTEEIALTVAHGKKAYFDIHISSLVDRFDEVYGLALELHDITEKKNRENALVKSNQQLDQVIYKTTHDLRAPLMSALALVNLAEQATSEEKEKYIEMIRKSLLKLDSFIHEMNMFFKNDKLEVKRELIDIRKTLEEETENLRNLASTKNVDIHFTIEGETFFFSDNLRVKTILTNILSNGIKYSDPGKKEPFIRINVFINEDFCQLRVVDNGIGIDPEYINKIFDLFFRATDQSQGTGLGLFIVKDTIQKLKGTIEVSSMLNQGTTFVIQIPNQINQPVVVV